MRNEPPRQQPRRTFRPPNRISLNPLIVLIGINVVFYIATMIFPQQRFPWGDYYQIATDKVTYYLGMIPYYITERPWTVVTSMFIHASIWHLLFNMFALFVFGRLLRKFIGDNTLLLVYFVGGIVGNLLFLALNLNDKILVVGASGAIYAIAGALVVLVPKLKIVLYGIIPMPLWVFVLVFMVILSFLGPQSAAIAWEAHIGGLATGLVFGLFFRRRLKFMIY